VDSRVVVALRIERDARGVRVNLLREGIQLEGLAVRYLRLRVSPREAQVAGVPIVSATETRVELDGSEQ